VWYLVLFLSIYAVTSSLSGVTNVPWMDIIGKSVPSEARVRVFALRRLVGGLFAIATGAVVSFVLSEASGLSFPQDYAVLFLLSAIFTALAIATFALIREPAEEVREDRLPLRQYLASGVKLLKEDDDYRRLLALRYLWGAGMMGTSFYVPYAITDLGIPIAFVGMFVSVTQLSAFLSNALWAWVGNRRGNCALMVYGTWFMGLSALVPISAPHVPDVLIPLAWSGFDVSVGTRVLFFSLAFLFQGFASSGTFTGRMAFVLDISPPDRRPTYTAFLNTFGVPQAVLPILAGVLAASLSYPSMFLIGFAFVPIALVMAARLAAGVSAGLTAKPSL
jgi:MFS family permease